MAKPFKWTKEYFLFLQGCGSAFICHLIRIRIQHFRLNTDPDLKFEKNLRLKKKMKKMLGIPRPP